MNQQKADIQLIIRKEFPKITTETDLLQLLNRINSELHKEFFAAKDKKVSPIKLATLKYYKNYKVSGAKRYKTFTIKKKSGKDRIINAPAKGLKLIQQCLNEILQTYYQINDNACGFIPDRSIVYGAKLHTDKPFVLNIDLKDFFDTITFPRVKKVLTLPPFNLKGNKEPLAFIIASLCCHPKSVAKVGENGEKTTEIKQVLPQGAPTSPILTNIVCRNLDRHLAGLAKRFKANYSRYADDITFSAHKNIFQQDSVFMLELKRIIEDEQGLTINPEKTRVQSKRQRQEVTGLVVNKKVNVSQRYVKQVRLWMHYWEKFDIEKAQHFFLQQYITQRGNVKSHKSHIENVIGGKLDYMRMVVGESNPAYKKLRQRFDNLIQIEEHKKSTSAPQQTSSYKQNQCAKTNKEYIADGNGIQSLSSEQLPFTPKEELEVLLDGLISDLTNENLTQ